jgi:glycosyltransferase involved in cell wall biosynthesis
MAHPLATVAMVPRERFSYTKPALESVFDKTRPPFNLVYVDGGSPSPVERYLAAESQRRGFQLIRTDHYLSPNQARNLALRHVTTKYVVFLDNDAIVTDGWLDALVDCAEQTGASIVGPIICAGPAGTTEIHMAGGVAHIEETNGTRVLHEEHRFVGKERAAVATLLRREPTELAEFHCMLVRTDVFAQLGPLDEQLLSALEHVDLCLAVREAGGSVYFEPNSTVTYVPPPPFALSDYPYFMLRWSDKWNTPTLEHFQRKWRLEPDDENLQELTEWLRKHRHIYFRSAWKIVYPVVGWRRANTLEKVLNRAVVRLVTHA